MQDSGHRQSEGRNRRIKIGAIVRFHSVATLHGADGRLEYRAARVAKLLSWIEVRLFANDAIAGYFLTLAIGIGDDPVAAQ